MRHKYVRFENYGFIIWPYSDMIAHREIGTQHGHRGRILSAGFVTFDHGIPICSGESLSLGIGSQPDDSKALKAQLGF